VPSVGAFKKPKEPDLHIEAVELQLGDIRDSQSEVPIPVNLLVHKFEVHFAATKVPAWQQPKCLIIADCMSDAVASASEPV
jgi:hypothetical protein